MIFQWCTKSTKNHISVFDKFVYKATYYKFDFYLGLTVFENAFDSVKHKYMLDSQEKAGLLKFAYQFFVGARDIRIMSVYTMKNLRIFSYSFEAVFL